MKFDINWHLIPQLSSGVIKVGFGKIRKLNETNVYRATTAEDLTTFNANIHFPYPGGSLSSFKATDDFRETLLIT